MLLNEIKLTDNLAVSICSFTISDIGWVYAPFICQIKGLYILAALQVAKYKSVIASYYKGNIIKQV